MTNQSTILIVDDTQQTRRLIEKVVAHVRPDCNVVGFDNALQVLDYLVTNTPLLIISDIQMPDMDGYDLMTEIYAHRDPSQLPIILLSAWATHGDDAQIRYTLEDRALPIVPIACKPINMVDLRNKVNTALDVQKVI